MSRTLTPEAIAEDMRHTTHEQRVAILREVVGPLIEAVEDKEAVVQRRAQRIAEDIDRQRYERAKQEVLQHAMRPVSRQQYDAMILDLARQHDGYVNRALVDAVHHWPRGSTHHRLYSMTKRGLLERVSQGLYRLPKGAD